MIKDLKVNEVSIEELNDLHDRFGIDFIAEDGKITKIIERNDSIGRY